jgi:hypothetical protein
VSTPSPYEAVLGSQIAQLHPRLQAYFRGIPDGHHGAGAGVFATVGTPRRWLWPILRILARQGVLFPVWERDVPFNVVNLPTTAPSGHAAVSATRTFRLRAGDRNMVDSITSNGNTLIDYLGTERRYRGHFASSVEAGRLDLSMTRLAVRIRTAWVTLPRWISPTVTLTERFDDESGQPHVEVVTTMPVLGRIYEYAGSFDYELRPNDGGVG